MEKRWRYHLFDHGVTNIDALREIMNFLNKHKLTASEVLIVPTAVRITGTSHHDDLCNVGLLYFADRELSTFG